MIRITSLTVVLLFVACRPTVSRIRGAPAVQTTGEARTATPDATFSCYMLTLVQMQYRVEDSDRGSGFIRGVKEDGGLRRGESANEATVVVAPASSGGGSTVSVTMRRVRGTTSGGRSSGEMAMTGVAQADLEVLSGACM
jgi:hypothetical protein